MAHPESGAPVVITGANRHIGAHMAHRFLDDGFAVIAQYRTATAEIDELIERGAITVQGDFADAHASLTIAEAIGDALAGPDAPLRALIHNASSFLPTDDDPLYAAEQFQAFFEVHMRAPYLLNTRLAGRLTGGDIVHITDIYADNPGAAYDLYCATKAGLQNLSAAFAKRLAPDVKVNAVQPGLISFEAWASDSHREAVLEATPLDRTGSPEDIYRAVRALMDNAYQTGAVVAVDGGRRLGR